MNTNPRQLQLLEEVRARKSATVEQLADTLGVTLQTVRRDVQRLAESGLLTRFHGGVRVPSSTVENLAHTQRETLHADGKARIARTHFFKQLDLAGVGVHGGGLGAWVVTDL